MFENKGLPTLPSFGMPITLGIRLDFPALDAADLDDDGDFDLILGDQYGDLYYSENTGPNPGFISDGDPSTVTSPSFSSPAPIGINVGGYASPCLADMDDDGDLDLAVGMGAGSPRNGRVDYYENVGTPTSPVWAANDPNIFAGVRVFLASAPAIFDMDSNGIPDLLLGSQSGYVGYYPNYGSASSPKWITWTSVATSFTFFNLNNYYEDDSNVRLRERVISDRLLEYADIINTIDQKMVDEVVFCIAHTATKSLMHEAAFSDVYGNNTESLYHNDKFVDYADIVDNGSYETGDYYSTLKYWVNNSGVIEERWVPPDIYYWFVVHPRVSYELPTYIDPDVVANMHQGASAPPIGKFWRWYLFNENDTAWPDDAYLAVKYPKDEWPPLMKEKLAGVSTLWNETYHTSPSGYDNSGHNNQRPWDYGDHAVEKVSHWVSLTLALNAQEHSDGNRPRQPVRIAHEHNGNCGELHDLTTAAFRAALIPALGLQSIAEDHCWNHFWDQGWHHLDNYWSNSASIISNMTFKHYTPGWNRDWTAIVEERGDSSFRNHIDEYHKPYDYNGDGYIDRGNVSVEVVDSEGNPIDGAKVSIGGWRMLGGSWYSIGDFSAYSNPDGIAFFTTSEARQYDVTGDTFDDGIQVDVNSKFGGGSLNAGYANRFKICIDPPNLPLYNYTYQVPGTRPKTDLLVNELTSPPLQDSWLEAIVDVEYGVQYPATDIRDDDGVNYHPEIFSTGIHIDAFFVDSANLEKYMKGYAFDAYNVTQNESHFTTLLPLQPGPDDWYFVLSNFDSIETQKVVNLTFNFVRDLPPDLSQMQGGELSGLASENVMISWLASPDDGGEEDDVYEYRIYRSTAYSGPYAFVTAVPADGSPSYSWVDTGKGLGDPSDYFYYVSAVDVRSEVPSRDRVAKLVTSLVPGPNLISIPLLLSNDSISSALATVSYSRLWVYDSRDTLDPWKAHDIHKYQNDLNNLRPNQAFWVDAIDAGNLVVVGVIQSIIQIELEAGWNLLCYPNFNQTKTVSELVTETGASRIEGFDPSSPPHYLQVLAPSYALSPKEGIWIKVDQSQTLVINN
ncbi:MAG: transglutaminase domain-containing protein, partial [Thermoplasmata archaeon]